VEKREEQVNEAGKGNRGGAQTLLSLSTKLNRLSEQARSNREFKFSNIAYLMTVEMLERSFGELRKDAAAGVDGITPKDYATDLRRNLEDLHERMKSGRYRAEPLRRVYIEKEDGNPTSPTSARMYSVTHIIFVNLSERMNKTARNGQGR
jgi:RNA-directed DNA polymerase